MMKEGIESRPLISGNLLRQPFLNQYYDPTNFKNADFIHENAFYIGNNQFVDDSRMERLAQLMKDFFSNDKGTVEISQSQTAKMLTNIDTLKGSNMFIRQYQTKNESTRIHQMAGYKHYVQFFDMKSLSYWSIYVDPKTTDGAEKKSIILKGRTFPKKTDQKNADGKSPSAEEYWKTQNRYTWKGIQSTNVHDNYTYASVHNERNLLELKKLYLEVDVERWNPNIYMGERIPLLLISQNDAMKANLDAQGEDKALNDATSAQPAVLDQFYSGYYVVMGMKITYNHDNTQYSTDQTSDGSGGSPSFFQTFVMSRREWPTPLG
jgi:hypothetical protein